MVFLLKLLFLFAVLSIAIFVSYYCTINKTIKNLRYEFRCGFLKNYHDYNIVIRRNLLRKYQDKYLNKSKKNFLLKIKYVNVLTFDIVDYDDFNFADYYSLNFIIKKLERDKRRF